MLKDNYILFGDTEKQRDIFAWLRTILLFGLTAVFLSSCAKMLSHPNSLIIGYYFGKGRSKE